MARPAWPPLIWGHAIVPSHAAYRSRWPCIRSREQRGEEAICTGISASGGAATATLLLAPVRAPRGATAGPALDSPLPIAMIIHDPRIPATTYGVDAVDQVVRSADGGRTWSVIFSPGDPLAADPATTGACLPGNYAHVTFLALDPGRPRALYIGTEGALGDEQDNGCGNAPGGLFYRATGTAAPSSHPLSCHRSIVPGRRGRSRHRG